MITAVSIAVVIAITGCTTTAGVMKATNNKYIGQSMDKFVLDYGQPQGKFRLTDGTYTYQWAFTGQVFMPGTTISNGSATAYGNTAYGTGSSTTIGGGMSNRICILNIHTKSNGEIITFKITKNTAPALPGYSSMCAQGLSK